MNLNTVLVSGGAGFIGSQLIKQLLPQSSKIYVIDNLSTGNLNNIPNSSKIVFIKGSITDKYLLREIMPKIDYVFHLACSNLVKSVDDMELDFHTNLYGQYILLHAAKTYGKTLKRIVYTSTASIYSEAEILPTPETYYKIRLPYAASKFSAEHYCSVFYHMYSLPITVLRLSNVYGPGQTTTNPYCGVVAKFFEASLNGDPLPIYGDGQQTRDFTYIADTLNAILLSATRPEATGQIYNVGTGIETPILTLANHIQNITGATEAPIIHLPKRSIDIIARRSINADKIRESLQWDTQYSLIAGLTETLRWIEKERIIQ